MRKNALRDVILFMLIIICLCGSALLLSFFLSEKSQNHNNSSISEHETNKMQEERVLSEPDIKFNADINDLGFGDEEEPVTYISEKEVFLDVFDNMSSSEILSLLLDRYSGYRNMADAFGMPDVYLFFAELQDLGSVEDITYLISLTDKIGYDPSVLFGSYVADGNHEIHRTNSDCFNLIPPSDIIVIGPFASRISLIDEISDGDMYLDGYRLCQECFGD